MVFKHSNGRRWQSTMLNCELHKAFLFFFFFSSIYFIEYPLVLWDKENKVPVFYLLFTICYSVWKASRLLSKINKSVFTISFPMRIAPSFWLLSWFFPKSIWSCSIPFFSRSDLGCTQYSKRGYASDYNIYVYLILLPDLFLLESSMLGVIFGCCYILSRGL